VVIAEIDGINGNGNHGGVVLDIKDNYPSSSSIKEVSVLNFSVPFMQKGCKIYLLSVRLCLCFLLAICKIRMIGLGFSVFFPKNRI
jgi:hypothetical protein